MSSTRKQEAGHEFATLLLSCIEKGRCCRLEAAGDDLVDHVAGKLFAALRQRQRHHADAVFVALKIALPVERLQRIAGVILESAEESRETKLPGIGVVEEVADEVERILVEYLTLVISLGHQIIEFLPQIMEEDSVLVDMLQKILLCRQPVLVELDFPILVIEVQHRVQRMVIQRCFGSTLQRIVECERVQNRSNPCLTLVTSSSVPRSSNL